MLTSPDHRSPVSTFKQLPYYNQRTQDPEIPIVDSPDQMPAKIEQISRSGMGSEKSLGLPHRFKSPHSPLSHPGRFVQLLCSVIGIPVCDMDGLRNNLAMSNRVAA
jgi:hypothetical protein